MCVCVSVCVYVFSTHAKHITLTHRNNTATQFTTYNSFLLPSSDGRKFNGFIVWNYQLSLHNDHRKFRKVFRSLLFRSTGDNGERGERGEGEQIVCNILDVIMSWFVTIQLISFFLFFLFFSRCGCCLHRAHITIDRLANWNNNFFRKIFMTRSDMICSSATTLMLSYVCMYGLFVWMAQSKG